MKTIDWVILGLILIYSLCLIYQGVQAYARIRKRARQCDLDIRITYADREAIAGDFRAVGDDLRGAMKMIRQEETDGR